MATYAVGLMVLAGTALAATPECPNSNGETYTGPNGNVFTIECGIDYEGGNLGSPVTVQNLGQCVDACDANGRCVDVSLSGVACYLKGTLGQRLRAPGVVGALKTTPVTNPLPLCPGSNGESFVSTSGHNFTIECDTDHAGGDLKMAVVDGLEACINACGDEPRCVDVSLSGEACYLKSQLGQDLVRQGVNGAIKGLLVAEPVTTRTTTTTSTASSSSSSSSSVPVSRIIIPCPGDGTQFVANSYARFAVYEGYEATGASTGSRNKVASINECVQLCDRNGCAGVSFSEGVCTFKQAANGCYRSSGAFGARLVTPRPQCPSEPGTTYTALDGQEFQLACDQDYIGQDIFAFDTDMPSGNGGSLGECLERCSTYDGCYAATLQGGGCYLKGYPVPASRAAKGLLSGLLLNATAPVPGPSTDPEDQPTSDVIAPLEVAGFEFLACYQDDQANRILAGATEYDVPGGPLSVTAESCADFCDDYTYFGLEFGGQCFCGDDFEYDPVAATGQCNHVCAANSSQTCGGSAALQVYRIADYLDPEPSEEATTARSSPATSFESTVSPTSTEADSTSVTSISSIPSSYESTSSSIATEADTTSLTSISSIPSSLSNVASLPSATFTTITDYITSTNGTLTRYGATPSPPSSVTASAQDTASTSADTTSSTSLPISSASSDSSTLPANRTAEAQETTSSSASIAPLPRLTSTAPSAGFPIPSNASVISNSTSSRISAGLPLPTGNSTSTSAGWNSSVTSVPPVQLPSPIGEPDFPTANVTLLVTPVPASTPLEGPAPMDSDDLTARSFPANFLRRAPRHSWRKRFQSLAFWRA